MADLDFDELDKAVNNLMAGVDTSKRQPGRDDPEEKVVDLDANPPEASAEANVSPSSAADSGAATSLPAPSTDDAASSTTTAPVSSPDDSLPKSEDNSSAAAPAPAVPPIATPSPSAPASAATPERSPATKRRGQFMDIVHPSSSMKPPVKAPRREGVTLAPSASFTPPAAATPTPVASVAWTEREATGEAVPEPVTPAPELTPASVASTAPKIDLTNSTVGYVAPESSAEAEPMLEPETTAPGQPPVTDGTTTNAGSTLSPPMTTPFLPDAKVEKRPLGGVAPDETSDTTEVDEASDEKAGELTEPEETQVSPITQLPAELHSDVVSVESDELPETESSDASPSVALVADTQPETESQTTTEPEKTPEPAANADDAPAQVASYEAEKPASPASQVVPGGGSIPQQYTEAASTGDQTSGSIYDTANYHQPIADEAPAKSRHHPVTLVVWLVILLVVGAVAGAAIFYFTRGA